MTEGPWNKMIESVPVPGIGPLFYIDGIRAARKKAEPRWSCYPSKVPEEIKFAGGHIVTRYLYPFLYMRV